MVEEEALPRRIGRADQAVRSPRPWTADDTVGRRFDHHVRLVAHQGAHVQSELVDAPELRAVNVFGEPGAQRKVHAGFGEGRPETAPVRTGDRAGRPLSK